MGAKIKNQKYSKEKEVKVMALLNFGISEALSEKVARWAKEGLEITVDKPDRLEYEFERRPWPYFILAWLIGFWAAFKILAYRLLTWKNLQELRFVIPHLNFWFDYSDQLKAVRKGAASWRALDILYNYFSKFQGQDGFKSRESDFWIGGAYNSQAIRNRLKLTKDEIKKAVRRFVNEPEVRIFSIASGSAQAVVESLQELGREISFGFKVVLLDVDQTAIDASKALVERAGMLDRFIFLRTSTSAVEEVMTKFKPQIVEMVGFLDYRPRDKAIELVARIKKLLPNGGVFLTCNIRNNPERPLVDYCLMWRMIYRNPKKFAEIMIEAGYNPRCVRIVYEPFKIHGLAICQA